MKKYIFSSLVVLFSFTNQISAEDVTSTCSNLIEEKGSNTWKNYYQKTINAAEPYKTLLLAHMYLQMEGVSIGKAADLGAGTGRDTLFLLKSG